MLPLLLALATGPSSARYELVPVAVNGRGQLLFRTWSELNPQGAHAAMRAEVGWLVVSSAGLWREVPHAVAPDATQGDAGTEARHAALRREFEAPFDWGDPPASVVPLLREFGFRPKDAVRPSDGAGAATWTPRQVCAGRTCVARVPQRTLGGLESEPREGSRVRRSARRRERG